jgi:hypothetical protein
MPLKSKPYYYAECDNCGKRATYHDDEITAWEQKDAAVDEAIAIEWTQDGEKLHCPNCPPLDADEAEEAAKS